MPQFENEEEFIKFFQDNDMVDYTDEVEGDIDFSNLKVNTKTISLRMPESLLNRIKVEANKRDVPYQTYMKIKLDEIFS